MAALGGILVGGGIIIGAALFAGRDASSARPASPSEAASGAATEPAPQPLVIVPADWPADSPASEPASASATDAGLDAEPRTGSAAAKDPGLPATRSDRQPEMQHGDRPPKKKPPPRPDELDPFGTIH
jgi:hypothetical protein